MSCFRVLLSIIFPPLAVMDKGCGSVLIVFILTLAGWIPGVIAALVILNNNNNKQLPAGGYGYGNRGNYGQPVNYHKPTDRGPYAQP